jgi:hypothetical protein
VAISLYPSTKKQQSVGIPEASYPKNLHSNPSQQQDSNHQEYPGQQHQQFYDHNLVDVMPVNRIRQC